ncbi:MAG TPA: alpha/beta fold hydrolase [Streptosporangiaceae bacterium]
MIMSDGVRIASQVHGAGGSSSRLPLLLTHGFGESARMWAPNVAALSADRPVITWDMRGHGDSDSPEDQALYTQQACLADMAALLDEAGAERAVLGGLSLGGYLSLAFRNAYPHRVAALLLFDTGPGFRNDEARQRWNEQAMKTADRLERSGPAALGRARAARGMLTQSGAQVIESLPSVDVPTLVLVGADDTDFLGAASYVAAKVHGATLVTIAGAGHIANVDQPAAFNEAVTAFLAGLD